MEDEIGIDVHPLSAADQRWIEEFYLQRWGSNRVVSRGVLYTITELPGFAARVGKKPAGLITYHISCESLEIVTLDSLEPNQGVGSALIGEILKFAKTKNLRRIWLITTNDNTPAMRFYKKIGFNLVKVHKDAVQSSRELKPEIPLVGLDGIPIRHEIELEYLLS
jgi:ribosomal protein S18 acetylase RimI-like enzyme